MIQKGALVELSFEDLCRNEIYKQTKVKKWMKKMGHFISYCV